MKTLSTFALVVLMATFAEAKPKSKSFNLPCETVYKTAKQMASEKPYKLQSAETHTLFLETGSFWKAGSQNLIINFDGDGAGCKVTVNAPYSGVRRNGTVFLDRLTQTLVEPK
jgi:hypothetical protein